MIKLRAILGRRYVLLIAATVIGALAGFVSASLTPRHVKPKFVAAQVLVANTGSGGSFNLPQDALRVTRGAVPIDAAKALGEPNAWQQLAGQVTATADTATNTISITSSSTDPGAAKKLVAAFSKSFQKATNADLLHDSARKLAELQNNYNKAADALSAFNAANPAAVTPQSPLFNKEQQLVNASTSAQQSLLNGQVGTSQILPYTTLGTPTISQAKTSLLNVPTSKPIRAGLVGFLGLLLGIGLVLIIERAKQRIDTREELALAIGVPIIAEIGRLPKAKRSTHSDGRLRLEGVWAEPYRRVRAAIQFVQAQPRDRGAEPVPGSRSPQVFLITSAQPGEGKSTTTALTAMALAEMDVPTVVIGGDFRKPSVESLLIGGTAGPTLQDFAQMTLERPTVDDVVKATAQPNLWVAPSGPATREVATLTETTKSLIRECVSRGATVIIDSSPLQAANDTVDMLSVVDEVILVVRSGEATAAGLTDSFELLRRHDANLLGVVLVGTPGVGRLQTYYDSYYLHEVDEAKAKAKADPTPAEAKSAQVSNGTASRNGSGSHPVADQGFVAPAISNNGHGRVDPEKQHS